MGIGLERGGLGSRASFLLQELQNLKKKVHIDIIVLFFSRCCGHVWCDQLMFVSRGCFK